MSAGDFLARRSLEEMQASTKQHSGHNAMLKAATDGAAPSKGPLNKMLQKRIREISMRSGRMKGEKMDYGKVSSKKHLFRVSHAKKECEPFSMQFTV